MMLQAWIVPYNVPNVKGTGGYGVLSSFLDSGSVPGMTGLVQDACRPGMTGLVLDAYRRGNDRVA
jgi:hypothetical protein